MLKKLFCRNKNLKLIEYIALNNIDESKKKEALELIYKIAHIESGTCKNPHVDWRKEIKELKIYLEKIGEI